MKSKKQVFDLARAMKVDIEDNSSSTYYDITFWSESDFSATGSKCIVVSWFADNNKSAFWQECYNELSAGYL